MGNLNAIRETKKSYIVDLDNYNNRERYYSGTLAGQVLRIEKNTHNNLFKKYKDYYGDEITGFDVLLLNALLMNSGKKYSYTWPKGVHTFRKGFIVQ